MFVILHVKCDFPCVDISGTNVRRAIDIDAIRETPNKIWYNVDKIGLFYGLNLKKIL